MTVTKQGDEMTIQETIDKVKKDGTFGRAQEIARGYATSEYPLYWVEKSIRTHFGRHLANVIMHLYHEETK